MSVLLEGSFTSDLALRATVLLAGALLASLALRRGSAVARHAYWTVVTLALLLLPALNALLPPLALEWIPAAHTAAVQTDLVPAAFESVLPASVSVSAGNLHQSMPTTVLPSFAQEQQMPVSQWALLLWLLGVVACALPVALGVARARRLVRGATDTVDQRLHSRATAIGVEIGMRRKVRLLVSAEVRTPMTTGVLHPVVLLPATALQWDDHRLDVVLRHELVHARRADVLWQLLSRLSVACYWFHPLAWVAARRASLAREQACDEAVLGHGTRASEYARHLLDLAEPRTEAIMLPAMVRLDHPHLEERVMAILTSTPARHSRRRTIFASAAVLAWTLGVASATPSSAQAPQPPEPPAAREAPAAPSPSVAIPSPVVAPAAPSPRVAPTPAVAPVPPSPVVAGRSPSVAPVPPSPRVAPSPSVAIPSPRVAPAPPSPRDPCTFGDGNYRTDGNGVKSRVLTTTEGGIRICAAIQGDVDANGFMPVGELPAGATMTLATWTNGRNHRMVISGGDSRATPQWFVDGRERPYDQAAAEWRASLLDLIRSIDDKFTVRGQLAALRGEIAQARGRDAEVRGKIAQVRGENAQLAAEVARVRSRIAVENAEVARRRAVEVRSAEAGGAAMVSPRAEAVRVSDTHRRALEAEVAAASERRDAYRVDERVAVLEAERVALRTDESVSAVQRQIEGLDAERRIADTERGMTQQVTRLQRAVEGIR